MQVQIQYFDGCPNWSVTEERLREALRVVGDSSALEHCPVETQEDAKRLRFKGSPSILLNGQDLFQSETENYGLTCRVYPTPDGPRGSPTLRQLIDAVSAARNS